MPDRYNADDAFRRVDEVEVLSTEFIKALSENLCANAMFVNSTVRSWLNIHSRPLSAASWLAPDAFEYLRGVFKAVLIDDMCLQFMAKNVTDTTMMVMRVFRSYTFRGSEHHLNMYSNLLGHDDRENLACLVHLFRNCVTHMATSNTKHWSKFPYNHMFDKYWSREVFARVLVLDILQIGLVEHRFIEAAELIHYTVTNLCTNAPPHRIGICRSIVREAQRVIDGDYHDVLIGIANRMVDDFRQHTQQHAPELFEASGEHG